MASLPCGHRKGKCYTCLKCAFAKCDDFCTCADGPNRIRSTAAAAPPPRAKRGTRESTDGSLAKRRREETHQALAASTPDSTSQVAATPMRQLATKEDVIVALNLKVLEKDLLSERDGKRLKAITGDIPRRLDGRFRSTVVALGQSTHRLAACLLPGQPQRLLDAYHAGKESAADRMKDAATAVYEKSPRQSIQSRTTRAILVNSLPKEEADALKIGWFARKTAAADMKKIINGVDLAKIEPVLSRKLYKQETVKTAVKFMLHESNVSILSWGAKEVKLSPNETVRLGGVVRRRLVKDIWQDYLIAVLSGVLPTTLEQTLSTIREDEDEDGNDEEDGNDDDVDQDDDDDDDDKEQKDEDDDQDVDEDDDEEEEDEEGEKQGEKDQDGNNHPSGPKKRKKKVYHQNRISMSEFYKIIAAITNGQERKVSSVDYVTGNLVNEPCEVLQQIIDDFAKTTKERDELTRLLTIVRNFLKYQYSNHACKDHDSCGTHGVDYGLRKPTDEEANKNPDALPCERCNGCLFVDWFLSKLESLIMTDIKEKQKAGHCVKDCEDAQGYVHDTKLRFDLFRAHRLRVANQDQELDKIEASMIEEVLSKKADCPFALAIIDWKMKFEPDSARQTTEKHFGKRGISWHGVLLIYYTYDAESGTAKRNAVFLDQIQKGSNLQDGLHCLAMLEAALVQIGESVAHIQSIILQSDNAGCYHHKVLTLGIILLNIRGEIKVNVQRFIHTETQAGKSLLDAHFGRARLFLNSFLSVMIGNRYRKIETPLGLATALADNGGIKNAAVQLVMHNSDTLKALEAGLKDMIDQGKKYFSRCNDIIYHDFKETKDQKYSITVYAYSNIGDGTKFQCDFKQNKFIPMEDVEDDQSANAMEGMEVDGMQGIGAPKENDEDEDDSNTSEHFEINPDDPDEYDSHLEPASSNQGEDFTFHDSPFVPTNEEMDDVDESEMQTEEQLQIYDDRDGEEDLTRFRRADALQARQLHVPTLAVYEQSKRLSGVKLLYMTDFSTIIPTSTQITRVQPSNATQLQSPSQLSVHVASQSSPSTSEPLTQQSQSPLGAGTLSQHSHAPSTPTSCPSAATASQENDQQSTRSADNYSYTSVHSVSTEIRNLNRTQLACAVRAAKKYIGSRLTGKNALHRSAQDDMPEYKLAADFELKPEKRKHQGWARRSPRGDVKLSGPTYMEQEHKERVRHYFDLGKTESSQKMGPAEIHEALRLDFPSPKYCFPTEHEVRNECGTLLQQREGGGNKSKKNKFPAGYGQLLEDWLRKDIDLKPKQALQQLKDHGAIPGEHLPADRVVRSKVSSLKRKIKDERRRDLA